MSFLIYQQINFNDFTIVVFGVTVFVVIVYLLRLFVGIVVVNDEIEKLNKERDREIEEAHTPGLTVAVFDAKSKAIAEKYEKLISPLKRKKGYMFDILPFLSKK